jgi:hypothetical protein
MANSGSLTPIPQGLLSWPHKVIFLPAYREVQVTDASAAVIGHWVAPCDAEVIALHYNYTTAGTPAITDFDLQADGTSILTTVLADSDAACTKRGTISRGTGTYDIPATKCYVAKGTILSAVMTADASTTVDDIALCLVLRPMASC